MKIAKIIVISRQHFKTQDDDDVDLAHHSLTVNCYEMFVFLRALLSTDYYYSGAKSQRATENINVTAS